MLEQYRAIQHNGFVNTGALFKCKIPDDVS